MRISFILIAIVLFASCNQKEQTKSKVKTYFDLEGYFKNEAIRLSKKNRPILKTVSINGKSEQKQISIKNWEKEFGVFIDADINKGSWKGLFEESEASSPSISDSDVFTHVTYYQANDDKIPVKNLQIMESNGKIISIKIFIHHENDLYTSTDSLSYFPDNFYEIKKLQKIKLMDDKKYEVVGKF
jgi:hypothetical protein